MRKHRIHWAYIRKMIYLREAGKIFYLLAKLPDATLAFFQNDRNLYNPNDCLDM